MNVRVSLSKSARSFSLAPDQSVLEAALQAGMNLPHGCKGGNCGACRARLLEGRVRYPQGRPLGLCDPEVADGYILLCQARAVEDLLIEAIDVSTPEKAVIKRLPSRIERMETLCHDVLGVYLKLPVAESFEFQAGQYLDVMLGGGRRRSFSIASPPHDARLIELHVRRVPGGEWTESLFAHPEPRSLLSIEGPLGSFAYRPDSEAPLLLVGGGTGFAPLKSIIRHVIEMPLHRRMILYWGVRSVHDLYAHAYLQNMASCTPSFEYRPVLSEGADGWSGRRGWVHDVVLHELETLAAYDIYASGPPAMITSVLRYFPEHGARVERLFFDTFDYASDTLERQRLMAETKS